MAVGHLASQHRSPPAAADPLGQRASTFSRYTRVSRCGECRDGIIQQHVQFFSVRSLHSQAHQRGPPWRFCVNATATTPLWVPTAPDQNGQRGTAGQSDELVHWAQMAFRWKQALRLADVLRALGDGEAIDGHLDFVSKLIMRWSWPLSWAGTRPCPGGRWGDYIFDSGQRRQRWDVHSTAISRISEKAWIPFLPGAGQPAVTADDPRPPAPSIRLCQRRAAAEPKRDATRCSSISATSSVSFAGRDAAGGTISSLALLPEWGWE